MPNCYKKLVVGALYDFQDFQKGTFGYNFRPKRAQDGTGKFLEAITGANPVFTKPS